VKSVSQSLLEEVTRRLAAEFALDQVWLFGSHAWGAPDEGSDLDLLVVVRESNEPPIRRAQRAHRCLRGLGVAKDVLVKTRAEVERFRAVRSSLEAEIGEKFPVMHEVSAEHLWKCKGDQSMSDVFEKLLLEKGGESGRAFAVA